METQLSNSLIPILVDYSGLKKYFGLYKSTISKLVMTGQFTDIVKIGRKNYFRTSDVEAWISKQTVKVVSL